MSAVDNLELGLDADERIAVVDESTNEVVGSVRRAEMREGNLPHRATYVFVRVPGGSSTNPKLWVQKRTMIKDYCPGYLDPTAGGVVGADETYEENAHREVEEEMGVITEGSGGEDGAERAHLRHCFSFHYKDDRANVWGDAWDCVWGGKIVPQEVQYVVLLFACIFFFSNYSSTYIYVVRRRDAAYYRVIHCVFLFL
ncbi:unnamed protein product [Choristocarpus tenellus]